MKFLYAATVFFTIGLALAKLAVAILATLISVPDVALLGMHLDRQIRHHGSAVSVDQPLSDRRLSISLVI